MSFERTWYVYDGLLTAILPPVISKQHHHSNKASFASQPDFVHLLARSSLLLLLTGDLAGWPIFYFVSAFSLEPVAKV